MVNSVKIPNYTIGENGIRELGNIISKYGDKVLVIGGRNALHVSKDKLQRALDEGGIQTYDFVWYGGECTYNNIEMIKSLAEEKGYNLIIGVGGGKAIDTAKGAAEKLGIPNITVPTIASTCAAATALSVVYTEDNKFDSIYLLNNTPVHVLIDTDIIAESPWRYQWAGVGDTLAKYYEVDLATRGKTLKFTSRLAKESSILCKTPLIESAKKALEDNKNKEASYELEQIILSNIINTGLVSILVGEENNGAAAHGLFYGMTLIDEIEENHLHGEVVGYGILVMLMMDGKVDEVKKLIPFYKSIGLPTNLKELNITEEMLLNDVVLEKAVNAPDMKKMPYEITKEMIKKAVLDLDNLYK